MGLTRQQEWKRISMMMKLSRSIALATVVWTTAAMSLVAGFPHLVCRCPDGRVKPYCLGFLQGTSSCCEAARPAEEHRHTSSAATAESDQQPPCCCRDPEEQSDPEPAAPGDRVEGTSCTRTLTQPADADPAQVKSVAGTDAAFFVALPPSADLALLPLQPNQGS